MKRPPLVRLCLFHAALAFARAKTSEQSDTAARVLEQAAKRFADRRRATPICPTCVAVDDAIKERAAARAAATPKQHWNHGDRPFCGALGGALVAGEEDVTCERCLERIGSQDLAGGHPL